MHLPLLFTSSDVPLGRFDLSSLPQQQMVELFFTPGNADQARADLGGDADDACTWQGIVCTDGVVTVIDWHLYDIELPGSIDFQMLPRGLIDLSISGEEQVGEIDLTNLPSKVESFIVQYCKFTGSLDFGHLPRSFKELLVKNNRVTGIGDIVDLPPGMTYFEVNEPNIAPRKIRIGGLPAGDLTIDVSGCNIIEVAYDSDKDIGRLCS